MATSRKDPASEIKKRSVSKNRSVHDNTCLFIGFKSNDIDEKIILKRIEIADNNEIDSIEFKDGSIVKCSPNMGTPIIVADGKIILHDKEQNRLLGNLSDNLKMMKGELDGERAALIKRSKSERARFKRLVSKINVDSN